MKKILIADDEIPIRLLIHSILENEEYQIIEAEDGTETVAKCREEKPDLLILDLMMPGLSGQEVCRMLRSDPATAHLPIIILTAKQKISPEEARRTFSTDFYLTKPFSPLELLRHVTETLERSPAS